MCRMASQWEGTIEEALWNASFDGDLAKVIVFVYAVTMRCHARAFVFCVVKVKTMIQKGATPNVADPEVNVACETCTRVSVFTRIPR